MAAYLYLINKSYCFFLQKFPDFLSLDQVPTSSHWGDVDYLTGHLLPFLPNPQHPFSRHRQRALLKMQIRYFNSPAMELFNNFPFALRINPNSLPWAARPWPVRPTATALTSPALTSPCVTLTFATALQPHSPPCLKAFAHAVPSA